MARRYKPDSIRVVKYVLSALFFAGYMGLGLFFMMSGHAVEMRRSSFSNHTPVQMDGNDARIYGAFILVTGVAFLIIFCVRLYAELSRKKIAGVESESDHYW